MIKQIAEIFKYLVLHHIADKNCKNAICTLKKYEVSAHYIIDDDGTIFQLVDEVDIAYHAGISYWNGEFNINKSSIGIEFFSKDPYNVGFTEKQIKSGIILCKNIINKYDIKPQNIVSHSDIAYEKESGCLNRKDDPSHLFPWNKLADNNIGIFPEKIISEDELLFQIGDQNNKIINIKRNLNEFGYKIDNFNNVFDEEFKNAVIVFNRRFNLNRFLDNKDKWFLSSNQILNFLLIT